MGKAGGSSQRRYDRLRAREKAAHRQNLLRALVLVCGASVAAYFAVLLAAEWLKKGIRDSKIFATTQPRPDAFPGDLAQMLAIVLAIGAGITAAKAVWGRRQTTEAYAKGAAGERQIEYLLAPLEAKGWIMLHDRRLPGSRENIDHVAIGPPGVFVVETKHWTGPVVIRAGKLTRQGRRTDDEIDQVKRQVVAVERAISTAPMALRRQVIPVLCIHGVAVEKRPFWTCATVADVAVCSSRQLVRLLTHGRSPVLDAAAIDELGRVADAALRPMTEAPASWGRSGPDLPERSHPEGMN